MRAFIGAIQFLTVIPVPGRPAPLGHCAIFFPLVGAMLGLGAGLFLETVRWVLPFTIAALLTLVLLALVTGGLHEDGLADVADAFRKGRAPEKILSILKDSRIGAHGALALILLVILRWQALSSIAANALWTLPVAIGAGRTVLVALAWIAAPAGSGLAVELSRTLTTAISVAAILQGLALLGLLGIKGAWLGFGGSLLIVVFARRYFEARIGGVTGDCLGATGLIVETYFLLLLTCRDCLS